MEGVSPELVIGPGTEILAGEGKILTAGGIDAHIHFICPQQITEALASRYHHHVRWGNRPGYRDQRDHLYPRAVEYRPDARID